MPRIDTSHPHIIPQEIPINFDDFLLPCDIPTQIVKALIVIVRLVSSLLDDKDE